MTTETILGIEVSVDPASKSGPRAATVAEIESWIARVQSEIIDPHFVRLNEGAKLQQGSLLRITVGARYVRIVAKPVHDGRVIESQGSIWGYIDPENGNVLRSAGPRPAKHPRGNIFAANPLDGVGPNGPNYLR